MIVTDRFLFLHMPKTGGTFVTRMLRRLHDRTSPEGRWENLNKHGRCVEIPEEYRSLPVMTCVRNPLHRYVSQFEFGWWRDHPDEFPGILDLPGFPEIQFEDFVRLANREWTRRYGFRLQVEDVGWHTAQFIAWNTSVPAAVAAAPKDELVSRVGRALVPKWFLNTGRLNADLHTALLEIGHDRVDLEFILEAGRILPEKGRKRKTRGLDRHYTAALRDEVVHRERVLFELFPEFER